MVLENNKIGYTLEAVIAKPSVLEKATFDFADSKILCLTAAVAILPVTHAFFDSFPQTASSEAFPGVFTYLSQPLATACSGLSKFGTVAYVEADFFGGVGQRTAVAWENQQVVLGPLKNARAINKALRLLGVKRSVWKDEFDTVGLGRHRETMEWLTNQ